MLKAAKITDKNKIEEFCNSFSLGVRIVCYMNAYGFERDFFKVWFSEKEGSVAAVLGSFDGSVTVYAKAEADFEEIKAFLCAVGYKSLCAETDTFEKLDIKESSRKTLFEFVGEGGISENVKNGGDLEKVYDLISLSIPGSFPKNREGYLSFLSDFTFRQRRSLARLKTITENDKVLSCALTAAESEKAAMISGVACDLSQRGKGLGKKTVLTLAGELKKENKKVFVIALNDSAIAFYKKIGFSERETISFGGLD